MLIPMKESAYKTYLLTILAVIFAANCVDRLALGLVLQDIKADLHLTDTQLGFLSGLAFALFYATMGIPIARWADRGNRVTIISITTALWSLATAFCGVVGSFLQLLLIRIGVAVGEAGCVPPAHSLIADHFTRSERPRAVARYMLGAPLSVVVGYFLAGWLNEFYGWRTTFIVLGVPGLALAALAWLTLREPRRWEPTREAASGLAASPLPLKTAALASAQPSVKEVCVALWVNTTFRHLLFCFSVTSFLGSGIGQWQPAFFIRSYGMQTGELGTWFTVIYGLGGMVATYLGGELASRHAANNERLQLKAMALVYFSFGVISPFVYIAPNVYVAFGLMGLAFLAAAATYGPLFAAIQSLVPDRMRAMALATIYLFINLVGLGLGPLAVGALSDALRALFGKESLRYALMVVCPGYFWSAWHLWRASRTVTRDLEAAQVACDSAARNEHVVVNASANASAA
jgi:MFS family permease